jgi:predicted MFS family arabinose efflux permease
VLAVVTVPAHWFGLRRPWPSHPRAGHLDADPRHVARTRPFVLLAATLGLAALASFAAVVNLVPLLRERGLSTQLAAVALGLGGAGQVAGRLGYAAIARRAGVRTRTAAILLASAATTALLDVLPTAAPLVLGAIAAAWRAVCSRSCRPPRSPTAGAAATTGTSPASCRPR